MPAAKSVQTLTYTSRVVLPTKIYQGNTHNISLELQRVSTRGRSRRDALSGGGEKSSQDVAIQIPGLESGEQFLEVTLEAMAIEMAAETKGQQCSLTQKPLKYQWNCAFKQLGEHDLLFRVKLIGASGKREIGTVGYEFQVVTPGGLTQRRLWGLTILIGVPGLIGTITSAIFAIIQFIHLAGWH